MKRVIGIILILSMLAGMCMLTTTAAEEQQYIQMPAAFSTADRSEKLLCSIFTPANTYGGSIYIDQCRIGGLNADVSPATVSCSLDISDILPGRHILSVKIKSDSGFLTEQIPITIKDGDMPYITSASYEAGGEAIDDTKWQDGVSPLLTSGGYTVNFSEAYDADSVNADTVKFYFYSNGRKIPAETDVEVSGASVRVIPKRVPPVDELCVIEFCGMSCNGQSIDEPVQMVFIPKQTDVTVFGTFFFDRDNEVKKIIQGVSGMTETDGMYIERRDGAMHFYKPDGIASGSYADADVPEVANTDQYVVDVRVKVSKLNTDQIIRLFDGKDDQGKWSQGIEILKYGSLYYVRPKDKTDRTTWTRITLNTWTRISLVVDAKNGKYDIYKDKKLSKSGITRGGAQYQKFFRIDMEDKTGGGVMDFEIDDLKIYAGSDVRDDVTQEFLASDSIIDKPSVAKHFIGSASVFSAVGNNYYHGKKEKYPQNTAPVIKDNEAYVSGRFLSEVIGTGAAAGTDNITVGKTSFCAGDDGTFLQNGELYIKADQMAAALNKKYLWDNRGYFVLSDEEFTSTNSDKIVDCYDAADYIYRYVVFDNPRGEEIMADIEKSSFYGVHPRILYSEEDIAYIKERAKSDADMNTAVINEVHIAYDHAGWIVIDVDAKDSEKQNQAATAQSHMEIFAGGYLLTGNEEFAQYGVQLMDNLAAWTSLAWNVSNLTMGHWAMTMAVGYDTFYDYLSQTPEGIQKLANYRAAAKRLVFDDVIAAYSGNGGPSWIKLTDNFPGTIGGGVGALALCMADEPELRSEIVYILENIIKTNELSAGLFDNDGGYFEGISYSNYMLENFVKELEALWRICETDYSLSNSFGFIKAGDFIAYMQTPSGSFAISDDNGTMSNTMVTSWFAYRYGSLASVSARQYMGREYGYSNRLRDLYYYCLAKEKWNATLEDASLDNYYANIKTGSFRDSFSTSSPTFVGFHAMENGTTHDHLDAGEFMFEADGVLWAYDLGLESYSFADYFREAGYRLYRKHAEGHNVLLINPCSYTTGYYGQNPTGNTGLLAYSSKKYGAFVAFDLSDVYSRDVSEYKRGFYFGDGRKTLTVQDELNLKNADSDIEWNMHTMAEDVSVIDENTVVLKSANRSLCAEIYCSAPFDIEIRESVPVWASDEAGQTENKGKKLVLSISGISGAVNIAVKLIPETTADVGALEFVPISEWCIPDRDINEAVRISGARLSQQGDVTAKAEFPENAAAAEVLLDAEPVGNIKLQGGRYFDAMDAGVTRGEHTLSLAVTMADGSVQTDSTQIYRPFYAKSSIFDKNDCRFSSRSSSGRTTVLYDTLGKFKAFASGENYIKTDEGISFTASGKTEQKIGYYAVDKTGSYDDGVVALKVDFALDQATGDVRFEFMHQNSSYRLGYLAPIEIIKDGKFVNGEEIEPGRSYTAEVLIDLQQQTYYAAIDKKPIAGFAYNGKIKAFQGVALSWSTLDARAGISFKNFKAERLAALPQDITAEFDASQGKAVSEITIPAVPAAKGAELMSVIAVYDDSNALISAQPCVHTLTGQGDVLKNSCELLQNAKTAKLMLLDGMTPVVTAWSISAD